MKLNKLLQARNAFKAHAQEQLPTMLAYKIMKFMKASDAEGEFYDQQIREVINKYAKKNEKGEIVSADGRVNMLPGKAEECQKAINFAIVCAEGNYTFYLYFMAIKLSITICLNMSQMYTNTGQKLYDSCMIKIDFSKKHTKKIALLCY